MSGVGLSDNVKGRRGVFGMSLEEGLEEEVGIFTDHGFPRIILITVAESHASRLIQPQHMRCFGPAVRIQFRCLSVFIDTARSILRQQGQCRRAAGPAGEPNHQWNLARIFLFELLVSLFKHPEKEVLITTLVVLGTLDIHVSTDGLAGRITNIIVASLGDSFRQLMSAPVFQLKIKESRAFAVKDARREAIGLVRL